VGREGACWIYDHLSKVPHKSVPWRQYEEVLTPIGGEVPAAELSALIRNILHLYLP